MVKLPGNLGIKKKEEEKKKSISFWNFSEKALGREWKIKSISLRLKDIEPFEGNVRIEYDQDELDLLKDSIKNHKNIWNIDVFHIQKWDRYIISDWHRTHKAFMDLYNPDHKVEVIIRWEAEELNEDTEIKLMKVWFVTSNTKKNLWVHEKLHSIKKYLERLDSVDPSKSHKISHVDVYEQIGLSKSQAMKYNSLLEKFTPEQFDIFKEEEVSYKLLLELAKIKNEEELKEAIEVVKSWKVETTTDFNTYKDIKEEILEDHWDEEYWNGVIKEEIYEKLDNKKKEKDWDMRHELKSVRDIKVASKKIYKIMLNLNVETLNDEEKDILQESIINLKNILKNKQL